MSLLSLIFERVDYERLIEEGRDPIEVLHYKYQNVPTDIIDGIIEIDPTKKKSFSQWLLSKWNEESDTIVKNIKNGRIAKLFQHYKTHPEVQIKDCPSVEEGLRKFVPEEDTVLVKSSNPTTLLMNGDWTKVVDSESANDFDIVFNEDDWIIAVPNTYDAECKLGENMRWCTAGGRSSTYEGGISYYEHYLRSNGGKYYVNFDMSKGESMYGKEYPFTRYQFHFETKQFMDKDDEPVELGDIGIPDSAIEFYESEGYSTEDFENLEAKMERYEEQRYADAYRLNDDLLLMTAYDEDYNFEQPTESTDYYVYEVEADERDPIGWEEVPNPNFFNDVVVQNTDDFLILKKSYGNDEFLLITRERPSSGWRSEEWKEHIIKEWIEVPNVDGIFALTRSRKNGYVYSYFSYNGEDSYDWLNVKNFEKMFINEACMNVDEWNRVFIETESDGYHSLFAITVNGDLDCIIRKDFPINEKAFFVNGSGTIEGEYGRYSLYDKDVDENGNEYTKYSLDETISNGNYVVSRYVIDDRGKNKEEKNILIRGEKEPLLSEWFDEFVINYQNVYVIRKNKLIGYFGSNGQQIGSWYQQYGMLDAKQAVAVGMFKNMNSGDKKCDLIDIRQENVFAEFSELLTLEPINNKIVVGVYNNKLGGVLGKIYDYVQRKFCFEELDRICKLGDYETRCFYCKLANSDEHVIFDFQNQKIILDGIARISRPRGYGNLWKVEKMNGKINIFSHSLARQILPIDADEIVNEDERQGVIIFTSNNKYFPYNFKDNVMLINPNGIDLPIEIDYWGQISCSEGNVQISFFVSMDNGTAKFSRWENTQNGMYGRNIQEAPQEVKNLYARVTGQQMQEQLKISNNFKKMVERINEAIKNMNEKSLLD